MRIIKFGHACVRIEHDGVTVVIDPGSFTEPEAVDGADVVLITHGHADHLHPANLRATDAGIVTIGEVAAMIRADAPDLVERVTVVEPGQQLGVGLPVTVVGEQHAVIHPDIPRLHNSGYLITAGEETVYHPGDALTVPAEEVDILLAPSSAPWLRSAMAVDFVRDVGAPVNLSIHDRIYTDVAHQVLAQQMDTLLPSSQSWRRIADGADLV